MWIGLILSHDDLAQSYLKCLTRLHLMESIKVCTIVITVYNPEGSFDGADSWISRELISRIFDLDSLYAVCCTQGHGGSL